MSVILMTSLFYKALILQGEIWCLSLLELKGLKKAANMAFIWIATYAVANFTFHKSEASSTADRSLFQYFMDENSGVV